MDSHFSSMWILTFICTDIFIFQLQIKVSGQRGSLGLSIAGGKGSLPYKNHDEVSTAAEEPKKAFAMLTNACFLLQGIFISRVIKGGASEKAGIHVGDQLLEVGVVLFLIHFILAVKCILLPFWALLADIPPVTNRGRHKTIRGHSAGSFLSVKASMRRINTKQINKHQNITNQSLDSHLMTQSWFENPLPACRGNRQMAINSYFQRAYTAPSPLTPDPAFTSL